MQRASEDELDPDTLWAMAPVPLSAIEMAITIPAKEYGFMTRYYTQPCMLVMEVTVFFAEHQRAIA